MRTKNFHLLGYVDGREHPVSTGPRHSDGNMTLYIDQRDGTEIKRAFTVRCIVGDRSGTLLTVVMNSEGEEVARFTTDI